MLLVSDIFLGINIGFKMLYIHRRVGFNVMKSYKKMDYIKGRQLSCNRLKGLIESFDY